MKLTHVMILALGLGLAGGLVGCKKKEPTAAEKIGGALEDAAEGAKEMAEDAGEKIEDAAEDVEDAVK